MFHTAHFVSVLNINALGNLAWQQIGINQRSSFVLLIDHGFNIFQSFSEFFQRTASFYDSRILKNQGIGGLNSSYLLFEL